MNSTYGNDPRILRRIGEPAILLNAQDAEARGLSTGDSVDVVHADASLSVRVEISDVAPPGVAVCYESRWPELDAARSNVNTLNPGLRADLGSGTAVNSLMVSVVPSRKPSADRM